VLDVQRPDGSPSADLAKRRVLGISANAVDNNDRSRTTAHDLQRPQRLSDDHRGQHAVELVAGDGGQRNLCLFNYDVIPPGTGTSSQRTRSQLLGWCHQDAGHRSKTLIDALDFSRVRNVSCHDSYGRIYQMRTVFREYFKTAACSSAPAPARDSRRV